jgi:hypothetical protein
MDMNKSLKEDVHQNEKTSTQGTTSIGLVFPLSDRQRQLIDDKSLQQNLEIVLPSDTSSFDFGFQKSPILNSFLTAELDTPVLNEIRRYLHLVASSSFHDIDSLHEQRLKRRKIVITEKPGLHLVWYYDTIFIKPIPSFLLNFTAWTDMLLPKPCLTQTLSTAARQNYSLNDLDAHCKAALGYLRTYAVLVRHPSDFIIAQDENLIPKDISYFDFLVFIKPFLAIPESAVSPRYHFGQIRLTRLNWAVWFLQPRSMQTRGWIANRLYYQELYGQSSDYVVSWGPPLLFAFAVMSLILSSMQVVLAARGTDTWPALVKVSWGFSTMIMLFCLAISTVSILFFPLLLFFQWRYARKNGKANQNRNEDAEVSKED